MLDIIGAVTGLRRSDKVVRAVLSTFQAFQGYAAGAREEAAPEPSENRSGDFVERDQEVRERPGSPRGLGLAYNINVVLPETTNVEVYNAIFRSIRANLLQ